MNLHQSDSVDIPVQNLPNNLVIFHTGRGKTRHYVPIEWLDAERGGMCFHSYFAPRRGQPCAGCLVRESQRALGMLLDALEKGVSSPSHGLEIEDREDAIRKARVLYEMVEEARS